MSAIFEIQRGPDYSTWRAARPDQSSPTGLVNPFAEMIARSDRHPYLNPELAGKLSVRNIDRLDDSWLLVDAVRASGLVKVTDERSALQIGIAVSEAEKYTRALAGSSYLPSGLTTVPGGIELATMYKAQQKGTGSDPELSVFFTKDVLTDPNRNTSKTAITVVAFCRKNELDRLQTRLQILGYGTKDSNGKSSRGRG